MTGLTCLSEPEDENAGRENKTPFSLSLTVCHKLICSSFYRRRARIGIHSFRADRRRSVATFESFNARLETYIRVNSSMFGITLTNKRQRGSFEKFSQYRLILIFHLRCRNVFVRWTKKQVQSGTLPQENEMQKCK